MHYPPGNQVIATILRHDSKVTSYKIALLRAINDLVLAFPDASIGDASIGDASMVDPPGEASATSDVPAKPVAPTKPAAPAVAVPLHMLAERWIAYYWPLVDEREPIYQGPRAFRDGRLRNDMDFRPHLTELRRNWEEFTGVHSGPADGFLLLTEMRTPHRRSGYPPELTAAFEQTVRAITKTLQMPIRYAGQGDWTVFEKPARWRELSLLKGTNITAVPGTWSQDVCLVIGGGLWGAFRELSLWVEALSIHEWCLFTESVNQFAPPEVTQGAEAQGVGAEEESVPGAILSGGGAAHGESELPLRARIYALLTARPDNRRPLTWERNQIELLMLEGTSFICPWTKKLLSTTVGYDLDHLLPLAVYPINELWNLLPVDSRFNQHEKRARIPSRQRLEAARPLLAEGYANYEKSPALESAVRQDARLRFARFEGGEPFAQSLARRAVNFIEEVARARSVARF